MEFPAMTISHTWLKGLAESAFKNGSWDYQHKTPDLVTFLGEFETSLEAAVLTYNQYAPQQMNLVKLSQEEQPQLLLIKAPIQLKLVFQFNIQPETSSNRLQTQPDCPFKLEGHVISTSGHHVTSNHCLTATPATDGFGTHLWRVSQNPQPWSTDDFIKKLLIFLIEQADYAQQKTF
jgi:hypothetical protein